MGAAVGACAGAGARAIAGGVRGGGGGVGAGAGAASGVVWRVVVFQVGAAAGACGRAEMRATAGGVIGGGGGAAAAGAGGKGGACSWQSHRTLSCSNSRVVQFEHTMVRLGQELQGLIVFDGASQCTQARAGAADGAAGSCGVLMTVVPGEKSDGWNLD